MEEISKIFNRFDANGDGKISKSELANVLGALGPEPTEEEVIKMMAEMDTDGDGFIDLKEFADFHVKELGDAGINDAKALRDAFEVYDIDKNGLISASELYAVLKRLGEKSTLKDCQNMISAVDQDGDGQVNFEEFKNMMGHGKPS